MTLLGASVLGRGLQAIGDGEEIVRPNRFLSLFSSWPWVRGFTPPQASVVVHSIAAGLE